MSQRKTILIVHSDAAVLRTTAAHCRAIGLTVQTAETVLAAFTHMDQGLPDLVCLDVELPTGNDLSFCEMMCSDPQAAQIPVIILSQDKDPEIVRRCGPMCAYYVRKSDDLWPRIEPVIYELVDVALRTQISRA